MGSRFTFGFAPRGTGKRADRAKRGRRLFAAGVALGVVAVAMPFTVAPASANASGNVLFPPVTGATAPNLNGFQIDGNLLDSVSSGLPTPSLDWNSPAVQVGGNGTPTPQPIIMDPVSMDPSVFAVGTKETQNPSTWTLNGSAQAPNKGDIGNVYAWSHIYTAPPPSNPSGPAVPNVYAYFGVERVSNTGTVNFSVELNQKPNVGTAFIPLSLGGVPNRTAGDVRLTIFNQGGAGLTLSGTYSIWSGTAAAGSWGPEVPLSANIVGLVNDAPLPNDPFPSCVASATCATGGTVPTFDFFEIGVDLTDITGILPATCAGPNTKTFNQINTRTRASTSVDSEMKDFAGGAFSTPTACSKLYIDKKDTNGNLVPGAAFKITPDPATCTGGAGGGCTAGSVGYVMDGKPAGTSFLGADGLTHVTTVKDADGTANGTAVVGDCQPGTMFTITEAAPPPGYAFDPTQSVNITSIAGDSTRSTTNTATFHDELGSVTLTKVDAANGQPLGGAQFKIHRVGDGSGTPDSIVQPDVTVTDNGTNDANPAPGTITVNGLKTGSYTVTEIAPPPGYNLPATTSVPFVIGTTPATDKVTLPGPTFSDWQVPHLVITKLATVNGANPQSSQTVDEKPGQTVGYTIQVTNNSTGPATGVQLSDTLPPGGLTWNLGTFSAGWTCSLGTTTATGTPLTCSAIGNLAGGASLSVSVSATAALPANCGTYPNTASTWDTNGPDTQGNPQKASATITVNCPVLAVVKSTTTPTANVTDPINYSVQFSNTGTGNAYNAVLSDPLPGAPNWTISVQPTGVNCSIATAGGAQTLSCNVPFFAAGASYTVTVTRAAVMTDCPSLNNTAHLSSDNTTGVKDSNISTITVNCPDLTLFKSTTTPVVSATDAINYSITATNHGPGAAYGVVINDTLPGAGPWTTTDARCTITGANLSCNIGNMAAGANTTVTVTTTSTIADCPSLSNTATATSTNQDTVDPSNTVGITVNCPALSIVKSTDTPSVNANDPVDYTVAVTNTAAAGTAYNVHVTDPLPGGPWTIKSSTGNPNCSASTGSQLDCVWATLAPGATVNVTVTRASTFGDCPGITNTAHVSSKNTVGTQDSNAVPIAVNCPQLELTKSTDTPVVSATDTIDYTLSLTNTGAGPATNAHVTDPLPGDPGWTVKGTTGTPAPTCSVTAGTLDCVWPTLAAGGTVTVTVTRASVLTDCPGLKNTGHLTYNGVDGTFNSNESDITVNCPALSILKSTTTPSVTAGDAINYTVVVTNTASAGTAYKVHVTDPLPGGTAWTISNTTGSPDCTASTGSKIDCMWKSLAAGASVTVTVSRPSTTGDCPSLTNTAHVSSSNVALGKDSNAVQITVNCPPPIVTAGGPVVPTIVHAGMGSIYQPSHTDRSPVWLLSEGLGAAGVVLAGAGLIAMRRERSAA